MSGTKAMKVPPQNLDAERCVIGGMLIDQNAASKVLELLKPEDFYKEQHRLIFKAIIGLYQKSEPADIVTVINAMKGSGDIKDAGGAAYLSEIVDTMPTAANIVYYAKIVHEKSILRGVIQSATEIAEMGFEADGNDVDKFLDSAERIIFDVAQKRFKPSFTAVRDIVKDSFKAIEDLYERKELVTGVPSGFTELDKLTAGFQKSDLVIIAGRPSMGKTAFALNVVQYAALEAQKNCAVFSLEMSKEQLVQRLLCSEAKVDATKLRGGFLSDSDWPKLTRAAGSLSDANIFIDDTPALNVLEIRAKSRRLQMEKGLDLVIVDYLQLMRGIGHIENREREISEISRSLKALAKEIGVPVLALSQLNRAVENRVDKRPQLADLRESGSIEQDADVVMFVYRDEVYNKESEDKGTAEIIIGKQRNGPIGYAKLAFLSHYTRFENIARGMDASSYAPSPHEVQDMPDESPF